MLLKEKRRAAAEVAAAPTAEAKTAGAADTADTV